MPERLPVIQPGHRDGEPPIFEKIAIVGLGLIGGSIALAVRQTWPASLVIAVDRKDVLEKAMVLHAIDVAADDLVVIAEADLVVLAAPVCENRTVLASLPEYVPGPAVVTDVGSTKRDIVEAAQTLPARFTFVGGHPLAGAARQGIEFARADLFTGRPWLFIDPDHGDAAVERLHRFVRRLGAEPQTVGAAEHDRLLAYLSHLPQLTASALMHIVGERVGPEGLALAGRGLIDTTRLASSPVSVWRDICQTNADRLRPALDELVEVLLRLRDGLEGGETLDRVFDSANAWRGQLQRPDGDAQ